MENRVLEVFYGADGKPYKDQERSVLFPVVGNEYQGANDFTHIRFYYQRLCGEDNTLVAVFKNAKGQLGCRPLSTSNDSTRNEKYALLPISDFLTQYKGDIYIALQCYRGDADAITWDSDNNMWVLNTQVPTIRSTANIKMSVNYAPLIVGGGEEELITIQVLLSYIAEKSNIDDVVIVLGNISQEDLSGYDNGQLFYDKTTDAYYRKKATSPYYELVNNGKGVLGASRLLCRLTEDNATIERALSICGSSMFVYNPNGKDYLYFVTEQVSGSTAVAFDIETRRTFIRRGMQDSDTLASVINTTYEADLDLNNVYVKTKGVKIGDIYHTIELVSGDLVIGSGSGDIWLQPAATSKYITSRGEGDAYKVEQYEIANADFVLDQCLDISNMPTLDELALSYASRPNSVLKFGNSIYRHAYEDNTYIYYKCDDDEHSTNLSGYDTYTLNSFIRIKKSDGQVDRGGLSFNFYNKTQSEGKFATNFTASLDTTTYVLTFTLKNANGVALATQTIDLPLESIVTSMTYYDNYTYDGTTYHNVLVIVLATTSVPTIVPVGSLISGLEHEALVEVSDISTPLTASQLALLEYPNAMITYGNNVYLKAEDNGTYITLSVPYISITTNSGHEEATRKFIVVTKSSGDMALTSDTTSFYNKSQTDTLLGEKADASSVVTDSDIETLGGAVNRIRKGNTWNEVAQEVNMSTTPKVVQSVADLPADNDGYLYVVLDNGYLYSWDEENQQWAQQYQYTSDLLTITEVAVGDDDYSYIEDKTNDNRPIQVASARKDGNGDVIDETYAKKDGNYPTMSVGQADQLNSTINVEDKVPYLFRTSGGTADIGNRENDKIVGGTIVWNQHIPQNYLYTETTKARIENYHLSVAGAVGNTWQPFTEAKNFIAGHKYLFSLANVSNNFPNDSSFSVSEANFYDFTKRGFIYACQQTTTSRVSFITGYSTTTDNRFEADIYYTDLTQMFGSTIADYIYSLEQNEAGSGVAWFKSLFPKTYYAYNSGTLLSVKLTSHDTIGFNQLTYDGESERKSLDAQGSTYDTASRNTSAYLRVLPNTTYYLKSADASGSYYVVVLYDISKKFIRAISATNTTFTTEANAYFMRVCYPKTKKEETCVNLSWSGYRNGEYEPYEKNTYALDSNIELRGIAKLDGNNNLYFEGDEYDNDGNVKRKYGTYTFTGNEVWGGASYNRCYISTSVLGIIIKPTDRSAKANLICNNFVTIDDNHLETASMQISYYNGQIGICLTKGSSTDVGDTSALQTYLQNHQTTIVFELETPTDETADPFQDPQIVNDFGTEQYVVPTQLTDVEMPVGHETLYPANLRDKVQRLPDMPSADGYYIVHYYNRKCAFYDLSTWLADNGYVKPTSISGYDNTKTQTLKNVEGVLTWVDDE